MPHTVYMNEYDERYIVTHSDILAARQMTVDYLVLKAQLLHCVVCTQDLTILFSSNTSEKWYELRIMHLRHQLV
jgi:hypothetical protein